MAIAKDNSSFPLMGADNKVIPFALNAATSSADRAMPFMSADNKVVPLVCNPIVAKDEIGLGTMSADDKIVPVKGGLKEIEKKLGIKRNKIIENFYGGDAVRLWRMYKATGDDYYIKLLIEYNEDDIINLKKIAEYCVCKLKNNLLKNQ